MLKRTSMIALAVVAGASFFGCTKTEFGGGGGSRKSGANGGANAGVTNGGTNKSGDGTRNDTGQGSGANGVSDSNGGGTNETNGPNTGGANDAGTANAGDGGDAGTNANGGVNAAGADDTGGGGTTVGGSVSGGANGGTNLGGDNSAAGCDTSGDFVKLRFPAEIQACIDAGKIYDFDGKKCFDNVRKATSFGCTLASLTGYLTGKGFDAARVTDGIAGVKLVGCGERRNGNTVLWQMVVLPATGDKCAFDAAGTRIITSCYATALTQPPQGGAPANSAERVAQCVGQE